jgi:glycosyltransferase involved in cell wall biosynthesis
MRPDVLFAPAYTTPLMIRCPIVISIHDVSFAAHPEWFSWREGARRRFLTRAAARRAHRVLTLSEFSRNEIVLHLGARPERVIVIAPAVDSHPSFGVAPPQTPAGCREPLVLYVGTIFNRRRVDELIAAFARLATHQTAVRLELVGANRTFPPLDLDRLIEGLRVKDRVRYREYISEGELRALYGRARVFAFLSEYEGFGLTPLEALRAGVPPVVLDTPVAHETLGDAAVYVGRGDPTGIAAAIDRLLTDTPQRAEVLDAGRQILARYSWDRAARETLAVLEAAGRAG